MFSLQGAGPHCEIQAVRSCGALVLRHGVDALGSGGGLGRDTHLGAHGKRRQQRAGLSSGGGGFGLSC